MDDDYVEQLLAEVVRRELEAYGNGYDNGLKDVQSVFILLKDSLGGDAVVGIDVFIEAFSYAVEDMHKARKSQKMH